MTKRELKIMSGFLFTHVEREAGWLVIGRSRTSTSNRYDKTVHPAVGLLCIQTWRRGQEAWPHFLLARLPQARHCLWERVGTSGTPTHLAAVLRPSRFNPQEGRSLMYWVRYTGKTYFHFEAFSVMYILVGNSRKDVTLTVRGCYEGWLVCRSLVSTTRFPLTAHGLVLCGLFFLCHAILYMALTLHAYCGGCCRGLCKSGK